MSASAFAKPAEKSTARCPNCAAGMKPHALPGHYGTAINIDACHDCNVLWFDQSESMQLAPDGVVELFQLVSANGGAQSAKLSEGLGCVRCRRTLDPRKDQVHTSKFNYFSCSNGHGRLTTYYQFLIEKQFVRELTTAERAKLAAEVKQIKCSGCGAAVNLAAESACGYCRAPIAVFDRNAAQKAIDHYLKERGKQLPTHPAPPYAPTRDGGYANSGHYDAVDLAADALWAMARFASRSGYRGASVPVGSAIPAGLPSIDEAFSGALAQGAPSLGGIGEIASADALSQFGTLLSTSSLPTLDFPTEMGSDAADSLADVGSAMAESGDGLLDLVGDGIGALVGSIFD